MMLSSEGIKRKQDVHYAKKRDCPHFRNYAKLYPCALWVRYSVPMRLLVLQYHKACLHTELEWSW